MSHKEFFLETIGDWLVSQVNLPVLRHLSDTNSLVTDNSALVQEPIWYQIDERVKQRYPSWNAEKRRDWIRAALDIAHTLLTEPDQSAVVKWELSNTSADRFLFLMRLTEQKMWRVPCTLCSGNDRLCDTLCSCGHGKVAVFRPCGHILCQGHYEEAKKRHCSVCRQPVVDSFVTDDLRLTSSEVLEIFDPTKLGQHVESSGLIPKEEKGPTCRGKYHCAPLQICGIPGPAEAAHPAPGAQQWDLKSLLNFVIRVNHGRVKIREFLEIMDSWWDDMGNVLYESELGFGVWTKFIYLVIDSGSLANCQPNRGTKKHWGSWKAALANHLEARFEGNSILSLNSIEELARFIEKKCGPFVAVPTS